MGGCAAKAEFESQVDEGLRLLQTAAESVGDAAVDVMASEVFQDGIDGAAGMQQHGQSVFFRHFQLFDKEKFLFFAQGRTRQFGKVKIQPDFPNCHEIRIGTVFLQDLVEYAQVVFIAAGDIERMDAQCTGTVGAGMGQFGHSGESRTVYRGNHDVANALFRRFGGDSPFIARKFRGIEMAMRIYPHGDDR